MATYAIGDLQGCYAELCDLLTLINFDSTADRLWFAGDLVNRGPDSLACLRFVHSLQDRAEAVLGNHDLHLLAVAQGYGKHNKKDTLDGILAAPDRAVLLEWLARRPLLLHDEASGFSLAHAGLHPHWHLATARAAADELAATLRGDERAQFLASMYGGQTENWSAGLKGGQRLRVIANCLTRLRYCHADGRIDLQEKNSPGRAPAGLLPWFAHPHRKTRQDKIIFGHWSTVRLTAGQDFKGWNVYPVDGGCLWGGELIALRLEDECYFRVPSRQGAA